MAQRKFRIVKRRANPASGNTSVTGSDVREAAGPAGENGSGESTTTDPNAIAGTTATPTTIAGSAEDEDISTQGPVDPATVQPRRGRGRPRKADEGGVPSPTPPRKTLKLKTTSYEKLLIGIHAGIGELLKTPEFAIDMDEATYLREVFFDMAKAYGWGLAAVDPKTEATINAAIAVGLIYIPRLKATSNRAKANKPRLVPQPSRPVAPPVNIPQPIRVPEPMRPAATVEDALNDFISGY